MFKKVLSNTFAQIFSKVVTGIIAIFLISLLTNYLSLEMYWLYSKIYNYTWIFVFLADLGLYAISIREITNSKSKEEASKIVWNVMSLRLALWIWILIFSTALAFFLPWYNTKIALISIIISSIFTIFQLLNSSILSLMQSYMKIEFSAVSLIVGKLVNVFWVALIVYFLFPKDLLVNWDYYWPFLWIMTVAVIWVMVNTFLNYLYARKIAQIHFSFDPSYIKHLFKISLPYWIALFLSVVYFKVDVILLSFLEWPVKGDMSIALYSLPMKIVEVIMVIWWFYMTSMLPSLTKWFKQKNSLELNKLIWISFKILFAFAFMVFVMWILFREYIILIIANENYLSTTSQFNSSDAFLIVFAVILFYFISIIFNYTLIAAEKQSKLLQINIIITIFNIVWNIILIPKYSFMWAGIVTVVSQILLFSLWYFYTNKIVKIKLPLFYIFRVIIFWILIWGFWYYILDNFSRWLFFDFFIYWTVIWILFVIYYSAEFLIMKKSKA